MHHRTSALQGKLAASSAALKVTVPVMRAAVAMPGTVSQCDCRFETQLLLLNSCLFCYTTASWCHDAGAED